MIFKVGDRVKMLYQGEYHEGKITIIGSDDGPFKGEAKVLFNNKEWEPDYWYYPINELELVNEKEKKMKTYENGQNLNKIENNFVHHPPKGDQAERYVMIREKAKELAFLINSLTPASREQSLAFTNLEECVMWANASIARNE